jgi:predicted ester cyclase
MAAEEIKALMRRWFEEANNGKTAFMAVFDELHAIDIVGHGGDGGEIRGLNHFKKECDEWLSGFPDLHFTIDDMIVEGDKVAIRTTWTGTHKGEIKGILPTNKKVTAWEIEIDRIVDGKIAEIWTRYDTLGLMQQLGLVPTSEEKR